MKEEIILTEEYIGKDIAFFLKEAPLNYLYGLDVFFTKGLNHNKYHLYGIVGLLGGHPNDYDLDNSIKVFVLSDALFDQMKMGTKDEILILLESKLNAKGQLFKDILIITESALIDYVKNRISIYGDTVVQNLINNL
jgi:hypothetical protein